MNRALLLLFFSLFSFASLFAGDFDSNLFVSVGGRALTAEEMKGISGELQVRGVEVLKSARRFRRRQETNAPEQVHCDILAQNRADDLGLDTRNQDGSTSDYNGVKVGEIYENFPNNRSTTPPEGTSGYVFSAYGRGKQHLETYTRSTNSETYTRYFNNSYSDYAEIVPPDYARPGVTGQIFVPLPRYGSADLYYR